MVSSVSSTPRKFRGMTVPLTFARDIEASYATFVEHRTAEGSSRASGLPGRFLVPMRRVAAVGSSFDASKGIDPLQLAQ